MPGLDLITIFVSRLNKAKLRYMVTGSVACTIYGEPRLTHDIDLVVELTPQDIERIPAAFSLDDFYSPPIESIRVEAGRSVRGHFNLIHHETGLRADVYVMGQDPLHHWAMSNRKPVMLGGDEVWLAPPEYVILRKLEFYREGGSDKHLKDISGILRLSSDLLDLDYLQTKTRDYRLTEGWQRAVEMART
jgi:hypothetical protein